MAGVVGCVLSPCLVLSPVFFAVFPVLELDPAPRIVRFSLRRILSCRAARFRLCVCCHSIVGLRLCLCDRVVSLWNSGDGLCGRKGVWCLLSTVNSLCVVVCVSVWYVYCLVVLWVVEWRGVVSLLVFLFSLFSSSCCWCSG